MKSALKKSIAILPGDGIGPEIMNEAIRVVKAIESKYGHSFTLRQGLIGGAAFEETGSHFPDQTLELCRSTDAILFGSVGGPLDQQHLDKWKGCEANSILALRQAFQFNANYRPAKVYRSLASLCPLRKEIVDGGIDVLVLRELLGDIYFGTHQTTVEAGLRVATDIARYDEAQIRAIAAHAFQAAGHRRKKVTSIDKANVLDTSRLWRAVVSEVAKEYPNITLEHLLVDNAAMQLIQNPSRFDVILCPNLFGDILSDEAAVFPGSLGLTPSASLNAAGFGMYEPSGGSAPDIAGKNIANPIAQILSAALMLRFSFGLNEEACAIEHAVEKALEQGYRTKDLLGNQHAESDSPVIVCSTTEMGDQICATVIGT